MSEMTVGELRRQLAEYPDDWPVETPDGLSVRLEVPPRTYPERVVITDDHDDAFRCESCGKWGDIEDSYRPEGRKGRLLCEGCATQWLEQRRGG